MSDKLQPYFVICAQPRAPDIFLHANQSKQLDRWSDSEYL